MAGNSIFPAGFVHRSEEERLFLYLEERASPIHIFGEPGVGKTTILDRIEDEYEETVDVDRQNIRPNHDTTVLFSELCHSLFEHLPEEKKEDERKLSGGNISTPLGGVGVSTETREADISRPQFGYRDALKKLSEIFPDEQPLFVCIDDVHELSEDKREIRGAIQDASEFLPSNIVLITSGRLVWEELETSVHLSMFTEEQTVEFLQDIFPALPRERAREIHDELGGHPLYIRLLAESNLDKEIPNIPEREVQTEIKKRYFDFLNRDERRILLATAPLLELNEELCTQVVSEKYDFDRVAVSDILDSLNSRSIVQVTGWNRDGLQTFKVHDVFREFLEIRSDQVETAQKGANIYYTKKLIQLVDEERTLETEVDYVTSWSRYLSNSVIDEKSALFSQLIEQIIPESGLRFYPSSLVVDELKTREVAELPNPVVESILSSVNESCNMGNDFYDEELEPSWAERLFEQGEFTDPDSNLTGYLGRVVENRPSFIRRVAEEVETDDERTLRFLISIAQELPAGDAAAVGQDAAEWIRDSEAYDDLAFQGLQLAAYLADHSKHDIVLEILDAVLEPRDLGEVDQLELDQGMIRYELTDTLDDIFGDLVSNCGERFINVLKSNLHLTLQEPDDREKDEYETIIQTKSISNLNYVESNRGGLKEILLDYLTHAVDAWIDENPADEEKQEYIASLLTKGTVFRRIGLYILGEYPNAFQGLVQDELVNKDNYRGQSPNYEFYHVLDVGFEHLDKTSREQVCEIIKEGPYTDAIEDRAARMAELREESVNYFEQRIREKWRRDRFYLIRKNLEEEYSELLDELVEKYGDPERLPFQPLQPEVKGGRIRQRGPKETEQLQEQSAVEVLSTAVDWEPPETEGWETKESGQREEKNHIGFSRQLRDLIKENPQRYAREISVLEDAHPRYAEAAFRAFKELVDDGQTFPWESIISLGQSITASPTEWSSRSRTNLATLINRSISSEEADFPDRFGTEVRDILLTLLEDADPSIERDQPSEGMAGHGDPVQVAINSVRPMALNAYITYLTWQKDRTENLPVSESFEPIEERIIDDPSLAVRSVIGRRYGTLLKFDAGLIKNHLEEIFPRDREEIAEKRFIAVWNSYTAHHRYWDDDRLRPYYRHAINLLDLDKEHPYRIHVRSTAAHIASLYLFEDEPLTDASSIIAQFYEVADYNKTSELASVLASSVGNSEVEEQWNKIQKLWDWRLDVLDPDVDNHEDEIRNFLDCIRYSTTATLEEEFDRIHRSLPFIADKNYYWRQIEEWLAEQADPSPEIAINLYKELVEIVSCDDWSSIARTSQENNRSLLYENAEIAGEGPLQVALDIADQFAAEGYQMDRDFLKTHLTEP